MFALNILNGGVWYKALLAQDINGDHAFFKIIFSEFIKDLTVSCSNANRGSVISFISYKLVMFLTYA